MEDEDGNRRQEGPRDEKEEAKEVQRWNARRNNEFSRLQEKMEKELAQWERHADRLERRAGSHFAPTADGVCPVHVMLQNFVHREFTRFAAG